MKKQAQPQRLVYNFIPESLILKLNEPNNWQIRSNAIEELEQIMKENLQSLSPFTNKDLLDFLFKLLNDTHFKIALTAINIFDDIIQSVQISQDIGESIAFKLIDKLSDSKIAIRQASAKNLKELFKISNPVPLSFWLETFLEAIENSNPQKKEESLNIFSFIIAETHINLFPKQFFENALTIVLPLTRDQKSKVKIAANETANTIEKKIKRTQYLEIVNRIPNFSQKEEINYKIKTTTIDPNLQYSTEKEISDAFPSPQFNQLAMTPLIGSSQKSQSDTEMFSNPPQIEQELLTRTVEIQRNDKQSIRASCDRPLTQSIQELKSQQKCQVKTAQPHQDFISNPSTKTIIDESTKFLDSNDLIKPQQQQQLQAFPHSTNQNKQFSSQNFFEVSTASSQRSTTSRNLQLEKKNENLQRLNEEKNDTLQKEKEQLLEYSVTKNMEDLSSNLFDSGAKKNEKAFNLPTIQTYQFTVENQGNNQQKNQQSGSFYKPPFQKKFSKSKQQQINEKDDNDKNDLIIQSKEYILRMPSDEILRETNQQQQSSQNVKKSKILQKNIINEAIEENEELKLDEEKEEKNSNYPFKIVKKKSARQAPEKQTLEYKQPQYLSSDELTPIQNPEKAFKLLQTEFLSDDWARQFDALTSLRRIIQHNPELLLSAQPGLHTIILDLLKFVDSLRSGLAKNSLLTLSEICQTFKKQIDNESEIILTKLIKKGQDSSTFIADEVRRSLILFTQNCSDSKLLPALFSLQQTKVIQSKVNIVICMEQIIEKNQNKLIQLKELDRFLQMLSGFMFDNTCEVRNVAKRCFIKINENNYNSNDIYRVLQRVNNEGQWNKIKAFLEKDSKKVESTTQFLVTNSITNENKTDKDFHSKTQTQKLKDPQEFENLPQLFQNALSQEWKIKYDTINQLTDLAKKYTKNLQNHKLITKFFDAYLKLINDSNNKVQLHAIQRFSEIITLLPAQIQQNIINVCQSLFTLLAATNIQVQQQGDNLVSSIVNLLEPCILVQPFCNGSLYAVSKARPKVISYLTEIIPEAYASKQSQVSKYICPVAIKLLEETKAEIKFANTKLIETLYDTMGKQLFQYIALNKIQHIVAS